MLSRRRLIPLASAALSAIVGTILALSGAGPLERLDLVFSDQTARWAADPGAATKDVVLVPIDEESLGWVAREYGYGWPWPREAYGLMGAALQRWGARSVAFDLVLSGVESERLSDWDAFREALGEKNDLVLGASMAHGTRARRGPPRQGVRLASYASHDDAVQGALLVLALRQRPFLLHPDGRWDLVAGGFDDGAQAAGTLADWGAAFDLLPASSEHLLAGLDPLQPDFRTRLAARLEARVVPLAEGAEEVTADTFLERFSLGRTADLVKDGATVALADVAVLPPATALRAVAGIGSVDQTPDADGVLRRLHLVVSYEGRLYPTFPLAAWLAAQPKRPGIEVRPGALVLGARRVPLDASGAAWIRFHGEEPYRSVPAWRVLRDAILEQDGETGEADHSAFAGRLVVVAPTAAAMRDFKPSPVSREHLGGDINAAAIDGLLTGRWVRPAPRSLAVVFAVLGAFLGAFAAWLAGGRGRSRGGESFLRLLGRGLLALLAVALAVVPIVGVAFLAYAWSGLWTGVAAPLLASAFALLTTFAFSEIAERRERRVIHEALGIYTSRLVADLVASGGVKALDPRRDDLSVFFSDIAGFTSFSERLSPEALAEVLNVYLTEMTDIVLAHDGVVDKYIGDAIMAFWGWRGTQPDHALKAVRCALKMRARLTEIRPVLMRRFGVEIVARAGINSGIAVAGNMGSAQKMNVTLMGDVVNLASRLEGANKAYGTELMIGEGTFERLGGGVEVRELDLLRVKGKDRPVRVFEPLCEAGAVPDAVQAWLGTWRAALEAYRARRFEEAKAGFGAVLERVPDDGPARIYVERCDAFLAAPPPEDWDGVFVMKTK